MTLDKMFKRASGFYLTWENVHVNESLSGGHHTDLLWYNISQILQMLQPVSLLLHLAFSIPDSARRVLPVNRRIWRNISKIKRRPRTFAI